MQKGISWRGQAWSSAEHCEVAASEAGIEARGSIAGTTEDGTEFEIKYSLELSPDWDIQHVVVRDMKNEGNELDLQRENDQWFDVDGMHLEKFDNVAFVDISLTPFTNTLPIKRLQFEGDQPQRIDVLYIDLPKFELRRVSQFYSKIGKNTYRFQQDDFSADLVVDEDGLVVVYPELFTSAVE